MNRFTRVVCLGIALFFPVFDTLASDPQKAIHTVFEAADDGFDMARTQNYYSGWVSDAIFETLLTYDYLARPAKLAPLTAESMPEIRDGGKTVLVRLRKHIYFTPDPAFDGKRRELTARDYAYAIMRLMDPQNRSPSAHFVAGKIVGLDERAARAKKTGRFDYDTPLAGLATPDRYTLRIRLKKTDSNFLYVLAYGGLAAVAREVIERYGHESRLHPVGTGPYRLAQYVPRSKIVLLANPQYRGFIWRFAASSDPADADLIRDMSGKTMPRIGKVNIAIIEEEQSRWLAFQEGNIAFDKLPQLAAPLVMDGNTLKPAYAAQHLRVYRMVEPEITFTTFNFKDPLTGGFSKEKIALRRAIAMAYNVEEEIRLLRNAQAIKAEMPVPAGVSGHDPSYRSSIAYDPELASHLLDHFGYRRQADGYRTLPDGSPLLLKIRTEASSSAKTVSEIWKRGLDRIGIRAQFDVGNFADNVKAATECRLMMWGSAWHADFPEGENFLQLLYGPNAGQGNHGCYRSAAFDALYEQAMKLPVGEQRNRLYIEMSRQMEADTAWVVHVSRVRNWLVRPWVQGFKKHPILQSDWQYLDIDASKAPYSLRGAESSPPEVVP
ncbi:MAG: ABC transporter substrate-binding protein [Burkholderiaceae bacterium]|jgi:ABC-type transport system substrate-binding protein|nr:ABC transporter substrate-binding protein [Burkholderiaceae bacterium]